MSAFSRFFLLVVISLGTLSTVAQDVIVKRDSSRIAAKVTEIDDDRIRYHKAENPDGPLYNLRIREVVRIEYANGQVDWFRRRTAAKEAKDPKESKPAQASTSTTQGGLLGSLLETENRPWVSATGGVAVPLGAFGDRSTDTEDGGSADLGYQVGLQGTYYLPWVNFLGVTASARYFRNPVDVGNVSDEFQTQIPDAVGTLGTTVITTEDAHWSGYHFAAGPMVTLPLGRFAVDASFQGGYQLVTEPRLAGTYDQNTTLFIVPFNVASLSLRGSNTTEGSFFYTAGLGLRVRITPQFSLRLHGQYWEAEPEHDSSVQVVGTVNNGQNAVDQTVETTAKQRITLLSGGIGLVWHF